MKYIKAVIIFLPLLVFSQRNEFEISSSVGLNLTYFKSEQTKSIDANQFHFNSDLQYQIGYSFQSLKKWKLYNTAYLNYSRLNYYYKFYNPFGDLFEIFENHLGRMELGLGLKKRINIPRSPISFGLGFNLIQRVYTKTRNYSTNGFIDFEESKFILERYRYDFSIGYRVNFHANLFAQINIQPSKRYNLFVRLIKNTPIYYFSDGKFESHTFISHPQNNSTLSLFYNTDLFQSKGIKNELNFIHIGIGANYVF